MTRLADHARRWPRRGGTTVLAATLGAAVGIVAAVPTLSEASTEAPAAAVARTADDAREATAASSPSAMVQISPVPAVTAPATVGAADGASHLEALEVVADGPSLPAEALDDPASHLVVVNKSRPLSPVDYVPEGLVHVDGVPGGGSERLRSEAADALALLREAAVAQGLDFSITSGYRSYTEQVSLHALYVGRRGAATAESFSARSGYSEHQTGWAADIYGSEACRVKRCFAQEPVGDWVAQNAWQYGWIVRYPKDQFDTTGYWYEPWHVRYVGIELSTWMHEQGIATLEEATGFGPAPDYLD